MTQGAGSDHRSRPRRRGSELTAAIYDAVLAELATSGYGELTMDAIAKRAGTGKASLYRRWPTRTELVMDAVYATLPGEQDLPDTGSLRDDIVCTFTSIAAGLSGPVGAALRGLRGEALIDPTVAERVRDYSRSAALHTLRRIVDRAAGRGEIDASKLSPLRLAAGPAIMRNHFLFNDMEDFDIVSLVDEVIMPLLTHPTGSLQVRDI
jgi:AcrR family transcriptional regulator